MDLIFMSFTILNRLTHRHRKNDSTHLAAFQIPIRKNQTAHIKAPVKATLLSEQHSVTSLRLSYLRLFLTRDHPLCAIVPGFQPALQRQDKTAGWLHLTLEIQRKGGVGFGQQIPEQQRLLGGSANFCPSNFVIVLGPFLPKSTGSPWGTGQPSWVY